MTVVGIEPAFKISFFLRFSDVQSFPATSIASSSVIRGGEPTLVIQEAAPNGAQEVTMEEERKKIIAQEMEEARCAAFCVSYAWYLSQTECVRDSFVIDILIGEDVISLVSIARLIMIRMFGRSGCVEDNELA